MKFTAKHTMFASFTGYITQAIVNNLAPLLFVTFQREFNVPLDKIGYIIFINFFVQILVDMVAAKYADKVGYRKCVCAAHILNVVGLAGLGVFPYVFGNAYVGIVTATVINAIGGGLLEVVVSPIVEAIPGDGKSAQMSLLHSFYCWGQVGVVLLSTAYFVAFGVENWRYLCFLWAIIPFLNTFMFLKVPIWSLVSDEEKTPFLQLLKNKVFWVFLILMLCAGASEIAMSQWSSLFAEVGLKVSKSVGDLLGMCMFAVLMGISRVYFGIMGDKIKIENGLIISSVLCIISYMITSFSTNPIVSLIGCGMCGLSVGLMWPGTYSMAAKFFPAGGTTMFAVLALAGDMGCSTGPTIVGNISTFVQNSGSEFVRKIITGADMTEVGLKAGLAVVSIFPIVMFLSVMLLKRKKNR